MNCGKLEIHVLQRICQIDFLFEFQIESVILNYFFSWNLYFKNILKDGNEIYKRLTATGKSVMTLFYHTLPVSLHFIFFFSVCHNIFYHMNMHYTYSSSLFYYSLWCSKENFILFTINQSFDCLCIFLVCKISLIENQSLAPLCLRIIVVLFLLYISIIVLMNII